MKTFSLAVDAVPTVLSGKVQAGCKSIGYALRSSGGSSCAVGGEGDTDNGFPQEVTYGEPESEQP